VIAFALAAAWAALAAPGALAATFTVNSIADPGVGTCDPEQCTLREAIVAANGNAGADTIAFEIPGSGVHTIVVGDDLPVIQQTTLVDGTTEDDYAGTPLIEINGAAVVNGSGLTVTGDDTTIRGLTINRFGRRAIWIYSSENVLVEDNYLGTDATGTTWLGGLSIAAIEVGGANAIEHAASNTVRDNLVSHGLVVRGGGSTNNTIRGNRIGTNAAGTTALNPESNAIGILLDNAPGNTIGGPGAGEGNLVSGFSGGLGIEMVFAQSDGNVVQGNRVGTNAAGTAGIPNLDGIRALAGADNNQIGGTTPGAGNLVSGNNEQGVTIGGSSGNVVAGNLIGTAADGTSDLGNTQTGVLVENGATNTTIGGTAAGAGNTIAFNGFSLTGVAVTGDETTSGASILGNSIHSNEGLGIDLGSNGVTTNDVGDGDIGPNGFQNFPVIAAAESTGSSITIGGNIQSSPSRSYRLEFFTNPTCGNGSGRTFLGSTTATMGGTTNAITYSATFPVAVAVGQFVTATQTDQTTGDTSEFSTCLAVTAPAPAILTVNSNQDTFDGACNATNCTLREAISVANSAAGLQTINFNIAPGGLQTIQVSGGDAPFQLSGPTVVDGTTQPGVVGGPGIELDGSLTNGSPGLSITGGGSTIKGLAINRFGNVADPNNDGIQIVGSGNNVITGNVIGLNPAGTTDLGNAGDGIQIINSTGNTIGGTTPATRNVISGNVGHGIFLSESNGNTIQGNYLGTNAAGTASIANGVDGIAVEGSSNNTIGGTVAGAGNVTSGNASQGISIFTGFGSVLTPNANIVQGNRVGTNAAGTGDVPNGGDGVRVWSSTNTLVGGTTAGSGNVVRGNAANGVAVFNAPSQGNRILGNEIDGNGLRGIDLGGDGVTANDAGGGDADSGPNNLQNFPDLTDSAAASGQISVQGTLDTNAGTYRVEFFMSPACDGSGNGEGRVFVGATNVTVTAGPAAISETFTASPGPNGWLTATATDSGGNTSEFSSCERIDAAAGSVALTNPEECVPGVDGGRTVDFDELVAGTSAAVSYASLGLRFRDDGVMTPRVYTEEDGRTTSSMPNSLMAVADSIEGEGDPLAAFLELVFDEPQTAVGFFMGNGGGDVEFLPDAELRAYDASGALLATLNFDDIPNDDVDTFWGIRRAAGDIRRIVVAYDGSDNEEIDDLCFTATPQEGEPDPDITITRDESSLPVGVQTFPLSALPGNQLPAFSGGPDSSPVGSIPVGSIPVGSIPVGSIPVGSIPVGSIPVGSIPVGSIPVGSIPVGSIGLGSIPVGSIPVGSISLSSVLLSQLPVNWTPILVGTPLATRPLQSMTLKNVYDDATARQRFNGLSLAQSGLNQSILSGVPLSALLLGGAPLSALPPPGGASTWCAAVTTAGGTCRNVGSTSTVVGLAITGVPVGSIPVGSIPVGSIPASTPVGSIPVGSIPVGSIDLDAAGLASFPVGSIANRSAVLSCTTNCPPTLGQAKAAGFVRPGATLLDLLGTDQNGTFKDVAGLILNDILLGILPRNTLNWEELPLDGLQIFGGTGQNAHYHVTLNVPCNQTSGLYLNVRLPKGFIVKPQTSFMTYGTGARLAAANPTTNATTGARWTNFPAPGPCAGLPTTTTQSIRLDFEAFTGYSINVETAVASAGFGTNTIQDTDQILIRQNWEQNEDPATAPVVGVDALHVVHIATAGDRETFRLPIPTVRGTRTTVFLSHIPAGADYDLVINQPSSPSLLSNPVGSIPVGSIPVEDEGSSVDNTREGLAPETLQDVPVGSIPVGSISATRGNVTETATVVSDGQPGFYTIQVLGYNGSHSEEPAVVRVVQTPPPTLPPCPARTFPNAAGAAGTLPASLPTATQALFLYNRSQLIALHGQAATTSMLTALDTLIANLASRTSNPIPAAKLDVSGSAAVRSAYTAWNASPCSITAANAVVQAINGVVGGYRAQGGGLPNLRYVTLLGSDEALPMARLRDPVTISNELDEASDLAFTTNGLTRSNALHAAAAQGQFLSDAPYGTLVTTPWLNRQLYLPTIPTSRLVETPLQIQRQLETFVAANGVLDPATALTTGYDFLSDGAVAIKSALDLLVGNAGAGSNALIDDPANPNDGWDATALRNVFTNKTPPDEVLTVNAHYNHYLLQPATGTTLVSTADLPALPTNPAVEPAFARRILFTMGCHGGLNVADTLVTGGDARLLDFAQAYAAQRAAVYVANTGFGYGDTVANALSERLLSLFGAQIGRNGTIGVDWLRAVHEYYNTMGFYGVYDEKALTEATMYGLPFWSVGSAPPPARDIVPPAGTVATVDVPVDPSTLRVSVPGRGDFWAPALDRLVQHTHYRSVQPAVALDGTLPLGDTRRIHGAFITSLNTDDVQGVDPFNALPMVDLAANEPERTFQQTFFPGSFVHVTQSREGGVTNQSVVVIAGQARPEAGGLVTERLVDDIGLRVGYSSGGDLTKPLFRQAGGTIVGGQLRLFADVSDAVGAIQQVQAFVNSGTGTWQLVTLTPGGGSLWTGNATGVFTVEPELIFQARDPDWNVAFTTNKAFNYRPTAGDDDGPEIHIETPRPLHAFGDSIRADFSCFDSAGVQSCTATADGSPKAKGDLLPATVGDHTFIVTAVDLAGNSSSLTRVYRVAYPFTGFLDPIKNPPLLNTANAGNSVPIKFSLGGDRGLNILAANFPQSIQINCATGLQIPSATPIVAPGSSALQFSKGVYTYIWKTEASWMNTCRMLTLKLVDGTEHHAFFRFVK
jgi:CSLREA domain-containing protein